MVIAPDTVEMARSFEDDGVDLHNDRRFPELKVRKQAGSTFTMRRWREGASNSWSVYIARQDRGITNVADFLGKVWAVEEPISTSGFVAPIGTLDQQGFQVDGVSTLI